MTLSTAAGAAWLLPAAAGAGLVAALGVRLGWLTRGAAVTATGVGALVVAGAGLFGGVLLAVFFATSSALGRLNPRREGPRRPSQVLANGGVAALLAAWRLVRAEGLAALPALDPARDGALLAALAGSLAAMTADTWATEVGMASGRRPVLIPGFRPVPPGTSGGVTWPGSLAAGAGALGMAALAAGTLADPGAALGAVLAGGLAGALADTWLGATAEARGLLGNDGVNLLASATGAAVAAALYAAWGDGA